MKSFKILFSAALLLTTAAAHADLRVFACEPEWASLTTEIGGDHVDVYSATNGKQDPHHIEARPSLIAKLRRADLLVCDGAELEIGWLPVLLRRAGNDNVQLGKPGYFMASDYVKLLEKPASVDRSQGDVHAEGNPHIQTSPENIALVAAALEKRLIALDADNAAAYKANYDRFSKRWTAAMARWKKEAEPIKHKSFAVYHDSWVYLADWLDIDISVFLEPKPGIPPTTGHLAELIDTVKQKNIHTIAYAAYQGPRASEWLAEKTGARAVELPFTVGGNDKVKNLFDLFDYTINALVGK
jgi:zinc/manganese transport system substrate-binding protein